MPRNHIYTMEGPEGALKRVQESRRRKKKALASSSVDSVSSPDPTSGKRPCDAGDRVEQISKLLWPQERKVLVDSWGNAQASTVEHILIGLKGAIHMSEKIHGLEKSLKEVRAEQGGLKAELGAMTAAKKDVERINRELQAQLDEERCNSSRLKSMLAKLESDRATKEADLAEEFDFYGCEMEVLVRAEMAWEYEAGKAGSWDLATIYAAYDELMAYRAEEAARIGSLDAPASGAGT